MESKQKETSSNMRESEKLQVMERKLKEFRTRQKATMWRSCCFRVDKRALEFVAQTGIGLGTMVFCIYQLYTKTGCEEQQLYSGILTLLIGVYLPQPMIKK